MPKRRWQRMFVIHYLGFHSQTLRVADALEEAHGLQDQAFGQVEAGLQDLRMRLFQDGTVHAVAHLYETRSDVPGKDLQQGRPLCVPTIGVVQVGDSGVHQSKLHRFQPFQTLANLLQDLIVDLHVLRVLGGAVGPIAPFLRHDEAGVVRILGTKFPHHQSGNASTVHPLVVGHSMLVFQQSLIDPFGQLNDRVEVVAQVSPRRGPGVSRFGGTDGLQAEAFWGTLHVKEILVDFDVQTLVDLLKGMEGLDISVRQLLQAAALRIDQEHESHKQH
mmetsp:Transcript_77077/g.121293  ORF Transcript_77077/g.121293 Transcript_77077/m.121293 type:complete len:275 (+) Transcript_77077:1141-1965(+)